MMHIQFSDLAWTHPSGFGLEYEGCDLQYFLQEYADANTHHEISLGDGLRNYHRDIFRPWTVTTLVRRIHFSTAHRYYSEKHSEAENAAFYGSSHKVSGFGHNFRLECHFRGPVDEQTGMIINLSDIDQWLKDLSKPLDHHYLNDDVAFFKTHVPTAENIARYCFEQLQSLMQTPGTRNEPKAPQASLLKVRLYEGENLWVDYSDQPLEDE